MEGFHDIQLYFRGEKIGSVILLAVSVFLLVAALLLFFVTAGPFAKGLSATLVLTALIGGVVGGTVSLRTDTQVRELGTLFRSDPHELAAVEVPRIEAVIRNFRYYRIIYAAAAVVAAIMLLSRKPLLHGLAVGLFVFAAIGTTIDHFAEARASRYLEHIRGIDPNPPSSRS